MLTRNRGHSTLRPTVKSNNLYVALVLASVVVAVIASWLGNNQPPSLIMMIASLYALFLQNKELDKRLGIIEQRVRKLEEAIRG